MKDEKYETIVKKIESVTIIKSANVTRMRVKNSINNRKQCSD